MRCVRLIGLSVTLLVVALITNPASARHRHHHHHQHQHQQLTGDESCVLTNNGRQVCGGFTAQAFAPAIADRHVRTAKAIRTARTVDQGSIIGGRPSGCPNRYCGCGLRKYLGLSDKRLNLASNWARVFPRVAGPAAGVAAVRSGHVMYIEGSAGNGQWLVRDYNSGGGLSRVHVRDVRGYIFVNPYATLANG